MYKATVSAQQDRKVVQIGGAAVLFICTELTALEAKKGKPKNARDLYMYL